MNFILCGSTNLRDLDFANKINTCYYYNGYYKFFCRVISWHNNFRRLQKGHSFIVLCLNNIRLPEFWVFLTQKQVYD